MKRRLSNLFEIFLPGLEKSPKHLHLIKMKVVALKLGLLGLVFHNRVTAFKPLLPNFQQRGSALHKGQPESSFQFNEAISSAAASMLGLAVAFGPTLTMLPEQVFAQPAATRQNSPTASGSRVNKDADSLLRYGLPITNGPVRRLQSQIEAANSDIKVKRIGAAIGDMQQARGTIKSQSKDMLKSVRSSEVAAATKLLGDIDATLDPGIEALNENVAQGSVQERNALDRASSSVSMAASQVRNEINYFPTALL